MNIKGFRHRIILIAFFSLSATNSLASKMTNEAISNRISPVGALYLEGDIQEETVNVTNKTRDSMTIYNTYCMACHTTGAAGAPKIGDTEDWDARLSKGREKVNLHAINGFNGMPARGMCMDCSDDEIIATIDYMLRN